jgi:hypothetical protein
MSARTDEALIHMSACDLATAIARGEVSATEAVEAHIARIEQVNGALNAVVVKRYDEARAEAKVADEKRARGEPLGPLHGVPITIKEHLDLTGTPATFGLPSRANILATQDDPWVARVRAACKDLAREKICENALGKLFSAAPVGEDGFWPCEPVRDALEEIATETLSRAVKTGLYNARGVHFRGEVWPGLRQLPQEGRRGLVRAGSHARGGRQRRLSDRRIGN